MKKLCALVACLLALACENDCEKVGLDQRCVVVGSHAETQFIWIDGVAYPMIQIVTDYACECVKPGLP